jgi:ferric-dicitrate binding protein FerR (iron transport regulator)
MKPACWRAGALLQRRAAGLSAAEGLRLEDHLAHCAACREAASMLSGLRALHASAEASLGDGARQRVIERALASQSRETPRAPRRARVLAPAFALAALCALASLTLLRSHPLQRPARDRVLQGELAGVTGELPSDVPLATEHGARLALAHATATLRPATRVRWNAAQRMLRLETGSVMVNVDPTPHRSFSVSTDRFDVRVLGTMFEVGLDHVSVRRGRVRVEPRDGSAPVILEAGGRTSFQLTQPDVAATAAAAPAHEAPAKPAKASTPDVAPAAPRAPAPEPAKPAKASTPDVDLAALLDRARSELAARHVDKARADLHQAIARRPRAPQLAEALSLRAECDLVAGDYAAARKRYLDVARRFSRLPAAESALFAAARIAAEHGDAEAAHALFERYLARYPRGSFAGEVERRLRNAAP